MKPAAALCLVQLLIGAGALADGLQPLDRRARELYERGQVEFAAQHFQSAYDLFRQAYVVSTAPALLYNMASALQGLGRPHDAAETLRGYLRAVPDDAERPQIEARVAALEEAQRLIDADRSRPPSETPPAGAAPSVAAAPPPAPSVAAAPPPTPSSGAAVPATVASAPAPAAVDATRPVAPSPAPSSRHRSIVIVAATAAAVLVLGGIAVGLGVGLHDPHTSSSLGTQPVTP